MLRNKNRVPKHITYQELKYTIVNRVVKIALANLVQYKSPFLEWFKVPIIGIAKIVQGKNAEWRKFPDRLSWMQQIDAVSEFGDETT